MTFPEFEKRYLKPYGFSFVKKQKGSHALYKNHQEAMFGMASGKVTDKAIMRFERKIKYDHLTKVSED